MDTVSKAPGGTDSSGSPISQTAILINRVRAMNFDFEATPDAPEYRDGLVDRANLRNSIRKLAIEMPETTRKICENFIPPEHLHSYERFYTGEYRDISNIPRDRLTPQALKAIDQATTIVRGVTKPDQSVEITRYTKERDDYDMVSFWQREPAEIAVDARAFHNRVKALDAMAPTSVVFDGKPYQVQRRHEIALDTPAQRQFTNGIGF